MFGSSPSRGLVSTLEVKLVKVQSSNVNSRVFTQLLPLPRHLAHLVGTVAARVAAVTVAHPGQSLVPELSPHCFAAALLLLFTTAKGATHCFTSALLLIYYC